MNALLQGAGVRARKASERRGSGTLLAMAALAGLAIAPAGAEPFAVRNQNPLLAPFGLPNPLPARLPGEGAGRFAANLHWGNAAYAETKGDESFTVDAEMLELRMRYERALGPRLAMYAELPWRRTWEGTLDGLIDGWHDLTGLPGDEREGVPDDRLLIEYTVAGDVRYRFDAPGSGIGDVPVGIGYQLLASEDSALAAWLSVKAPTGDADELTGSGAADVALSLAGERSIGPRVRVFGQLDAAWLGDGDLLPALQESFAWSAMAGATWNAWRALDLTVQLAGNSRVFDSGGALAGDALVVVFGGTWRTAGGWRLDVSVSEDADVNASPDVVFSFGLARALR